MTQYIDKSALVAEIEKRIDEVNQIDKASYEVGLFDAYKNVLSFLDTLEVKEVDENIVGSVWHDVSKKPFYDNDSLWGNQIAVYGESSMGKSVAVCCMIDADTIYSPISKQEYAWGTCPFTKWAYVKDLIKAQKGE